MYLTQSNISCGIMELDGIGMRPKVKNYKTALAAYNGSTYDGNMMGCFVLASVPTRWRNSAKFLKKLGFKQTKSMKNPNTGNKITAFIKTLNNAERREIAELKRKMDNN